MYRNIIFCPSQTPKAADAKWKYLGKTYIMLNKKVKINLYGKRLSRKGQHE